MPTCPKCGGSGTWERSDGWVIGCPLCKGSGEVPSSCETEAEGLFKVNLHPGSTRPIIVGWDPSKDAHLTEGNKKMTKLPGPVYLVDGVYYRAMSDPFECSICGATELCQHVKVGIERPEKPCGACDHAPVCQEWPDSDECKKIRADGGMKLTSQQWADVCPTVGWEGEPASSKCPMCGLPLPARDRGLFKKGECIERPVTECGACGQLDVTQLLLDFVMGLMVPIDPEEAIQRYPEQALKVMQRLATPKSFRYTFHNDPITETDPEIRRLRITLCGSTRFKKAWMEWNARLTLQGHVVYSVAMWSHNVRIEPTEEQKRLLDEVHLAKIENSDEVFVLDVGGYIGESTRREIKHAEGLGKPVRYLSQEFPDWTEEDCLWARQDEKPQPVPTESAPCIIYPREDFLNAMRRIRQQMSQGKTEVDQGAVDKLLKEFPEASQDCSILEYLDSRKAAVDKIVSEVRFDGMLPFTPLELVRRYPERVIDVVHGLLLEVEKEHELYKKTMDEAERLYRGVVDDNQEMAEDILLAKRAAMSLGQATWSEVGLEMERLRGDPKSPRPDVEAAYDFEQAVRGEVPEPGVANEDGQVISHRGATFTEAVVAYPEQAARVMLNFRAEVSNRLATALGVCGAPTIPDLLEMVENELQKTRMTRRKP